MSARVSFDTVPGTPQVRSDYDVQTRYVRLARTYQRINGYPTYDNFRGPDVKRHEVELGQALLRYVQKTPGKNTKLHFAAQELSTYGKDKVKKLKGEKWAPFMAGLPGNTDAEDTAAYLSTQKIALPPTKTKYAWQTPAAPESTPLSKQVGMLARRLFSSNKKPEGKYEVTQGQTPADVPRPPLDVSNVELKIQSKDIGPPPATPGPMGQSSGQTPGDPLVHPINTPGDKPYIDPQLMSILPKSAQSNLSMTQQYKANGVCGVLGNWNYVCPGTNVGDQLPTSQFDAAGQKHDGEYARISEQYIKGEITREEAEKQVLQADQDFLQYTEQHINDGGVRQKAAQWTAYMAMNAKHLLDKKGILDPMKFLTTDRDELEKNKTAAGTFNASLAPEQKSTMKAVEIADDFQARLNDLDDQYANGDIDETQMKTMKDDLVEKFQTEIRATNDSKAQSIFENTMSSMQWSEPSLQMEEKDYGFPDGVSDVSSESSWASSHSSSSSAGVASALPDKASSGPDTNTLLAELKGAITGLKPAPPAPQGPFNAGSMGPRMLTTEQVQNLEKTTELPAPPATNDVMRLDAQEANSALVIPKGLDQIRSDIEFDMFSVVRPGFGLGADNKMFAFENIRDKEIIGKGPLFLPRAYDGPTAGVDTVPLCLQNVVPTAVYEKNDQVNKLLQYAALNTRQTTGKGSLNVLGDDYGQLTGISDRGLNRPSESFLEPVIRIDSRWQRPKLEPGFMSSKRQFRKLYDGLRYPEHMEPHMFMDGGPTMKKARASLEVLI